MHQQVIYLQKKKKMPVEFVYNTKFKLFNESKIRTWLNTVAASENSVLGNITYAFFNDN